MPCRSETAASLAIHRSAAVDPDRPTIGADGPFALRPAVAAGPAPIMHQPCRDREWIRPARDGKIRHLASAP